MEKEIIRTLAELLGVDVKDVTPEKKIVDDLGADSLDLPEIMMTLEEKFNCTITPQEAQKIRTVGDAIEFVKAKAEK